MGVTAKSLGIDKLPVEERLILIGELWDSVADETESLPLSFELKAELDRRLDAADKDPEAGVPWEEVKKDTLARLRK
jgi:putative addiction module component (TIGR02574 family)